MRILSKLLKVSLTLLLLGAASWAEPNLVDVRAVAEAEKSFAQASVDQGIRASFLQYFADDSIVFAPGPVNGKALYEKYVDKGQQLSWQPIFATISSSGELGVTTGPWELRKTASDKTAIAFGQFLSIWKRQPDNTWKVIVDVGIDNPQPAGPAPELQLPPPAETSPVNISLRRQTLEKTERRFSEAVKADVGGAIADSASDQIRIFRDNSFPAVGSSAAKAMLGSDHRKVIRERAGGGVSVSGDLAYWYGLYSTGEGAAAERGCYLTIWQTDRSGEWKILIDLQKQSQLK